MAGTSERIKKYWALIREGERKSKMIINRLHLKNEFW